MAGSRKLQDYLVDRGVDAPARDSVPLICRGQEVLFAAGVGAGAIPPWDGTKRNIRLKWTGGRQAEEEETEDGSEF
jgi:tRNA(Ile)-lysidine synthase